MKNRNFRIVLGLVLLLSCLSCRKDDDHPTASLAIKSSPFEVKSSHP